MLLLLISTAALLGGIQAFTHEDANQYIDGVLGVRFLEEAQYSRLDPYKLDDINVSLNQSNGQNGTAVFSKGNLLLLSKVGRLGDCTVPFWQSANVTFTCFLRFAQLRMNYSADVTYNNTKLAFNLHVTIKGANVTIQVTSNPSEDIPNLRMLFINRIGGINATADISIGDSGKFIYPQIRNAVETKVILNLHRAINGRFRDALAYSIYKTPVGFAG